MEIEDSEWKSGARLDIAALTISPPPTDNCIKSFENWRRTLALVKSPFTLYPEIAYNAKLNTNRLHFHGYIEILDLERFRLDMDYLNQFCFTKIKPIYSLTKWLKYCKKELRRTRITLKCSVRQKLIPVVKSNVEFPSDTDERYDVVEQLWRCFNKHKCVYCPPVKDEEIFVEDSEDIC